jgi:integrase/recombinase XerD
VSELAKARWQDIYRDPAGRLGLRVVHGKGGKERVAKLRDDSFAALVALHGNENLDASSREPLIGWTGGAYSSWALWKFVKQATEAAQLSKPVSPHWLRHSHATLAAYGGASAFEIADALGHSKLETAQRYVHAAVGLERTTVDTLPAFT